MDDQMFRFALQRVADPATVPGAILVGDGEGEPVSDQGMEALTNCAPDPAAVAKVTALSVAAAKAYFGV